MGAKPARPDEEDNAIFHGGEPARSTAIVFRGRLWQTGQEIGISVGDSLTVLEGVVESGEELEAPLDPRIVVGHFADAFERLVIRNDAKLCAEVASKVLMAQTMLPASTSSGVQCLSESRVARLM